MKYFLSLMLVINTTLSFCQVALNELTVEKIMRDPKLDRVIPDITLLESRW